MTSKIPSEYFKKAALIRDQFPVIDFMTIVEILYQAAMNDELEPAPTSPPPQTTSPERFTRVRQGRKRPKIIFIDGKRHVFCNAKEMLEAFDLEQYYDAFIHLPERPNTKNNIVYYEACFLKGLFSSTFGSVVNEYTAYDFEDNQRTITLEEKQDGISDH